MTDPRRTDLYVGTRTWFVQHGLHREPDAYLSHGYLDLCLQAWPTAAGAPLHLATQWALLTWLLDDVVDIELLSATPEDVTDFMDRLVDAVVATKGAPRQGHPAVVALADLAQRTRQAMPASWWRRYRNQMVVWLGAAQAKLITFVQPGRVPTLREYLAVRPADGGMLLAAMWCELAEQCVTPDWDAPLVQGLLGAFSACGYLANDLAASSAERFTAVWALRRDGVPPLTARRRVQQQLEAEEQRFWWARTALSGDGAVRAQPRTGPVRDTARFAQNLDRFRVALSEWTAASSRYALAAPGKAP